MEVVKGKYVWLVVERHIDSDDVLRERAKYGDYEGHRGGSMIHKTTFIHPYPVWTRLLLSLLVLHIQNCPGNIS